ncbi:MAG TPA: C39 family peptidase [Candidatus Colwellbacteria bacterium]|nr:C39 family peptidase [Candidatus Colwellbacteria bacterium]
MLEVRPFQESLNGGYCGPASLKMVLDYYGIKKSESDLARLCRAYKTNGVEAEDIKRAAEGLGLKVVIKNKANFSDIRKYLDKGIPVIVDWFTRGRNDYPDSEVADGHYSVVVGLDKKHIYLQDPEIGKIRKIKRDDFLKVWFDFKGEYMKSPKDLVLRTIIAIKK